MQWKGHAHLHPIDVSYDDFKAINNDGDMNRSLLDNKELRKGLIGGYYKMMKNVAEISNQNLVRNPMPTFQMVGKLIQITSFLRLIIRYKQGKDIFQLGY